MSHGDYPVNEESHSDREWNRRMLSKDREIDRLRAELADMRNPEKVGSVYWNFTQLAEDYDELEAAIARVRELCGFEPACSDYSCNLLYPEKVLRALDGDA